VTKDLPRRHETVVAMSTSTSTAATPGGRLAGGPHERRPKRDELRRAALRDVAVVSPGVVPFGVTLGITAASAHHAAAAVVGAFTVFGGSAQLTTLTLLHLGSGLVGAVASGAVVNARLLLYGASLEPRFRDQPLWFRLLAPHFILDQTYLSALARPEVEAGDFRRYWAWLAGALLTVWTAAVGSGLLLGPLLPPLPHLALVGIALFVSMLMPRLVDSAAVAGAATAAGTAYAVCVVTPQLGILTGAAAGMVVATAVSRRSR
jgi:predicted branched-subunit amino acid permease